MVSRPRGNDATTWSIRARRHAVSISASVAEGILTDSLRFPLEASTVIFSVLLGATFAVWYAKERTLSIHSVFTLRREAFYWLAILFTFALGTATGDLVAEKLGVGYLNTGLLVLAVIAASGIGWRLRLDPVLAFWIAYILTRPLPAASASAAAISSGCPDAVKQSIGKSYPDATMTACKAEHEDRRDQFEVKLDNSGQKLEVDVAPDGTVLQTEVKIPPDQVPAKVMAAFATKYPGAKPTKAEKQVRTGKGTFYELAFPAEPKKKEATFAEDGSFVEEE
jgi:hypothetical protein